jgi:sugar phosphate permease
MGVFQSVGNPASLTLLADYFPQSKRSTVNSIWNSGIYVGSAVSSLGIIGIQSIGWRSTFNLMGISGLIIGMLTLLVVREPKR